MQLPSEFAIQTRHLFGEELFEKYLAALDEEPPVSIRVNRMKVRRCGGTEVPWCADGYYLSSRPQFTFDPLFHAGCYYVQEASSMFLDEVLRQWLPQEPISILDMCAAPGGKSTLLASRMPAGSTLVCNEPNPKRAQILSENIQKWGCKKVTVTNNYPRDFQKGKALFDVILCDAPCSGEGMFRKDPATIEEWSPQNVEKCWRLQRDIIYQAWQCLRSDGLFIYSTCTLNTKENEENILWMTNEFEAEILPVNTHTDWHITNSLLEGFTAPVYRFIPGLTQGEGLFLCILRKKNGSKAAMKTLPKNLSVLPNTFLDNIPNDNDRPYVDLDYYQAISYLRREAIELPERVSRGIVVVGYQGHALGIVKNIGNRANNLYPKEWRIKSTHIPGTTPIIIHP